MTALTVGICFILVVQFIQTIILFNHITNGVTYQHKANLALLDALKLLSVPIFSTEKTMSLVGQKIKENTTEEKKSDGNRKVH